jgi:hypothetical protein
MEEADGGAVWAHSGPIGLSRGNSLELSRLCSLSSVIRSSHESDTEGCKVAASLP